MEGANDAAEGLRQGAAEEIRPLVGKQAAHLHHRVGDDHIGGVPADIGEGIAGGGQGPLVIQGGLDGELAAGLELAGPFFTHRQDLAAEFVADDHRVFGHVIRHPLVIRALDGRLVGGHAQAVRNHPGQDLVRAGGRQLEGFQPQIVFSIEPYGFGLHGEYRLSEESKGWVNPGLPGAPAPRRRPPDGRGRAPPASGR